MKTDTIRSKRETPLADSFQVLGGLVGVSIGAGLLWGWDGFLIAFGLLSYLDIRIDDLCNALARD